MMVAAISEAAPTNKPSPRGGAAHQLRQNSPSRRPLLPAEKDNGVVPRKPKSKKVSSRYLSPSPSTSTSTSTTTTTTNSSSSSSLSRRCPSPLLSRSTNSTPLPSSRAQSADRRRPAAARPVAPVSGEVSAAAKMLITSTRRLSVSFQGEGFSLPISKAKEAPSLSNARKATPERRRATPLRGGGEGDGSVDQQHRWPARTRQAGSSSNQLSRSSDYSGDDRRKLPGIGSGMVVRALQQSMAGDGARQSFDCRLSLDLGNAERLSSVQQNPDANSLNESSAPSDLTASDTDSVSSGSTSGVQEGLSRGKGLPRGIAVSARFWQETNSRLRRLQDPGSPLSTSPGSRMGASSKFVQSKKFGDSPLSSPRGIASPTRGAVRSASPSKLWTSSSTSSPLRGNPSPSRARNSLSGPSSSSACSTPSILSFSVDLRRGKMGENRIVDAHMLRLLYNRHLQWRFVNARADATSMAQKLNAEKNLWNAWVAISELRHSVTLKRIKLLLLRKKLKLTSILRGQMNALEEWAVIDRDHSNSLMGVTEALRASTLRLPINGKAVADIQNLKDAVGSAVDVVHAMASTICSLSSKVEGMNCLILELANVTTKEQILLQQCKDFLSTLSSMQVKDCSLRTHILQLSRVPSTSSLTTTTRV